MWFYDFDYMFLSIYCMFKSIKLILIILKKSDTINNFEFLIHIFFLGKE